MGIEQLSEKEQDLLILIMVKEVIAYAEENHKTFEEVLNEDVFPNEASTEFAETVCKGIESLKVKGYITGEIELEYEEEINPETFEETKLDSIDFVNCTFENISITMKGKAYICADTFKESGKAFYEKSKPVIKQITSTALQVMVEQVVVSGMKAVGFSV